MTAIRAEILRGALVPRQRLVEADLCEWFSAGRAVVRQALRQLAAEGLVEIQLHRGARVREILPIEAADVLEARMVLEGLVAARAAERADQAQAETLRELVADLRKAAEDDRPTRYGGLRARVHQCVRDSACHETANGLIEQLWARTARHPDVLSLEGDRATVSLSELQCVVEAIATGKPPQAEAAMRRHLAGVVEALRSSADSTIRHTRSSARPVRPRTTDV